MIGKLVRRMLTAQTFSALTVSLCLLIDNIMIGRFLGAQALAAYSLANPVLLAFAAIGSMLSAGIQVVCSRSIGKGSQEDTDQGFSSAIGIAAVISLVLTAAVLLLHRPLAQLMGAGASGELYENTASYMAGFILGAPASMGALILVPFMQMAGQTTLLIAAVLGMTVSDVALDILNVTVYHGGMYGMGLASSVSYIVALVIGAAYFFSKKCVFHFSPRLITAKKIGELFKSGVPSVFNMASSVVFTFIMNRILLGIGGSLSVAAFSLISTIGNASNCVTTGIGGVSLTLAGVFYHEDDSSSLKELLKLMTRYSFILGILVGLILLLFAPYMVSLFLPGKGAAWNMAVFGLRLFGLGIIPCCLNNMLKNIYQATGRVGLTEGISVAEAAVLPSLAALILSRIFGLTGAWFYFAAGEILTLLGLGLMIWRMTGRAPWQDGASLLLDSHLSDGDDTRQWDIRDMSAVTRAAGEAEAFCLSHGMDRKLSSHVALCVEEMAANTLQHGIVKKPEDRHTLVRLAYREGKTILRFRDDCGAFDPVHYIPKGAEDALGLRLVSAMCNSIRYTYSMNLNNLTLEFASEAKNTRETH